jgi:hypothetical protein
MAEDEYEPITASRRIGSPAAEIFQILADPGRHRDLDGSEMLQELVSGTTISGVGDVFVMKMYFTELGYYEMNNTSSSTSRTGASAGSRKRGAGTRMPTQRLSARPAGGSGGPLNSLTMARTRPS